MTSTIAKPAPPLVQTLPQVQPSPGEGSDVSPAVAHAAVEAAIQALDLETHARLADIPGRLKAMIARADRGNPAKRNQRKRDAQAWADNAETVILQSQADRLAELLTGVRTLELAALEALRGGTVRTEVRDIETVVLKNGAPVWYRGRKSTKRERIARPRVSRDGLETLATSHLDAEGNVRMMADRKTPMRPAIDQIQHAAGVRYRRLYEDSDPETGLRAVDPGNVGGGRSRGDPFASETVRAIQGKAEAARLIRRIEKRVREAVEAEHGVKQGAKAVWLLREVAGKGETMRSLVGEGGRQDRATDTLRRALDALAEQFGLI